MAAKSESQDEYSSRFNALKVALKHIGGYNEYKNLVDRAEEEVRDQELTDDTAYKFTKMLY